MRAARGDVALGLGVVHRARHAAALGVHQEFSVGILGAALFERFTRQPRVHVTLAEPDVELAAGDLAQVVAEEDVGEEQHRDVWWQCLDYGDGITRGAAIIRFGFDGGSRVHVGDDDPVRVRGAPGAHVGGLDRRGERAPRRGVGNQDPFVGIRDRGRLGHEMHAADHEGRRIELGRAARHLERIGDDVGQVLDLGTLVIMRENGGAACAA